MILSNASVPVFSTGPNVGFAAALFTRMPIPPNVETVTSTIRFASPDFPTFAAIPSALAPEASSSFTVASTASALRLTTMTRAPAAANAVAIALPMPRVPPVTSATLPSREKRFAVMRTPVLRAAALHFAL